MSDQSKQPQTQEEKDKELFNPDNMMVNIGGKTVPFSKINKPHTVIINPEHHKPKVDASSFPDVEPAAKEREEKLAAERAAKKNE